MLIQHQILNSPSLAQVILPVQWVCVLHIFFSRKTWSLSCQIDNTIFITAAYTHTHAHSSGNLLEVVLTLWLKFPVPISYTYPYCSYTNLHRRKPMYVKTGYTLSDELRQSSCIPHTHSKGSFLILQVCVCVGVCVQARNYKT